MPYLSGSDDIRIPLQLSNGCVIASLQIDLTEGVLTQFRQDLLEFIDKSAPSGVIVDVSGVDVMDVDEFESLRLILDMTRLMGTDYILVGLNAGIVSTLIRLNAHTSGLNTAVSLDDAHRLLSRRSETPEEKDEVDDVNILSIPEQTVESVNIENESED